MTERADEHIISGIELTTPDLNLPIIPVESPTSTIQEDENIDKPSFEELFNILREARLARHVLATRKNSKVWANTSSEGQKEVDDILTSSKEIRGYIKLPNRLPPYRAKRASVLIQAGKEAQNTMFQRLRDFIQPQLEEEFRDHAGGLKFVVEDSIRQVIVEGRTDDKNQIQSNLVEQFGVKGEAKMREVRSRMTSEEVDKYEKNVQMHISRLKDRLKQFGVDLDDAKQTARLAVNEALNNHKPELGKLAPYMFRIINGRLWDLIRSTSPFTRGQQKTLREISDFESNFEQGQGRLPTIEEIEELTGIERDKIIELKETPSFYSMADLGGDLLEKMENGEVKGLRDYDNTVEPENYLISRDDVLSKNERITAAFELIEPRAKIIIYRHDIEGIPHHKTGNEIGLSESRVVQIRKKALKELKKMLTEGINLKEFLSKIGISYAVFHSNGFGEGLHFDHSGRGGARLGPIEMVTIKKRAEAHKQMVLERREEKKKKTASINKSEKSAKRRMRITKQTVKRRLNGTRSHSEIMHGNRPTGYKPIKPENLEVLLELYGDQLKGNELRVLKLRSGLEDGIFWTLEEAAIAVELKTSAGARYSEQRGLEKLRELEPSIFEENTS